MATIARRWWSIILRRWWLQMQGNLATIVWRSGHDRMAIGPRSSRDREPRIITAVRSSSPNLQLNRYKVSMRCSIIRQYRDESSPFDEAMWCKRYRRSLHLTIHFAHVRDYLIRWTPHPRNGRIAISSNAHRVAMSPTKGKFYET